MTIEDVLAEVKAKISEIEIRRPEPPKLITARTAAEICGIAMGTWYDLVRDGVAPQPVPLSDTLRRWELAEVISYIEERKALRCSNA